MKRIIKITLTSALFFLLAIFAFGQDEKINSCSVVLEVEFLKTGKVGKVSLVSDTCEKDSGFQNQAIEAVKKVKFKPKKENGEKVTEIKKVRYDFKIDEQDGATVSENRNTESIVNTQQVIILEKPKPVYPNSDGVTVCVTGTVRLRVEFLSVGKIGKISVVSGLPHGITEKAIEAAEKIKFLPAKENGVSISTNKIVTYSFSIY